MNVKHTRRFEMLLRVRDFGNAYGHQVSGVSAANEAFVAMNAAIDALQASDVVKMSATTSGRADRKRAARKALVALLERCCRLALERANPYAEGSRRGQTGGRSLTELTPSFVYQVDRSVGEQLITMNVAVDVRSTDPVAAREDDDRADLVRMSGGVHVEQTDRAADRPDRRRKPRKNSV